jgi:two-component system, chemotaxis family, response regulator Rcp1
VVELVSAGAQGEEIEKARHAARMVTSRPIEDRAQNGQMTEMCTILAKENPNEAIRAQQSIIRQYLGGHLLDPTEPPPSRQVYDVWKFSRLNVNGPTRVQLNDIVVAAKNIRVVQILLVEDNPVDVQLLQERLNTVAIPTHLHAVRSVEVALGVLRYEGQAAQAPRPDVIFLDQDLPEMDWLYLLDEIANDPRLKDIPVVIFNGAECQIDHLIATGVVAAYLTHSLERAQFVKLLGKLQRCT